MEASLEGRPDPLLCDIRPLLSVPQVAELLGIRPRTVYELASRRGDGGLPFMFKVGGSLRARPEDLERWIDSKIKAKVG